MLKTIRNINLKNKRVLVRVDFNLTLDKKGRPLDDFRVRASLATIKFLLKNNAKIILVSHLGRPKSPKDKKYSLRKVAVLLAKLIRRPVKFLIDPIGSRKLERKIERLKSGRICLLENLRFYKEEEENDLNFSKALSKLAEIYINDGFGVSHRAHASVVGVTKFLPSYAGLLLEKEVKVLDKALKNPLRPFCIVIGGAKISTKIKLIKRFLKQADKVLLGGALANTVLLAQGIPVGKSLIEKEMLKIVKNLSSLKLCLPIDAVVSEDPSGMKPVFIKPIRAVGNQDMILDIGPETIKLFKNILEKAKMVIWNGPMGLSEIEKFSNGTYELAKIISKLKGYTLVGGGDTVIILNQLRIIDKFDHVSTGGGAMLDYLTGEKLPGIEVLESRLTGY